MSCSCLGWLAPSRCDPGTRKCMKRGENRTTLSRLRKQVLKVLCKKFGRTFTSADVWDVQTIWKRRPNRSMQPRTYDFQICEFPDSIDHQRYCEVSAMTSPNCKMYRQNTWTNGCNHWLIAPSYPPSREHEAEKYWKKCWNHTKSSFPGMLPLALTVHCKTVLFPPVGLIRNHHQFKTLHWLTHHCSALPG